MDKFGYSFISVQSTKDLDEASVKLVGALNGLTDTDAVKAIEVLKTKKPLSSDLALKKAATDLATAMNETELDTTQAQLLIEKLNSKIKTAEQLEKAARAKGLNSESVRKSISKGVKGLTNAVAEVLRNKEQTLFLSFLEPGPNLKEVYEENCDAETILELEAKYGKEYWSVELGEISVYLVTLARERYLKQWLADLQLGLQDGIRDIDNQICAVRRGLYRIQNRDLRVAFRRIIRFLFKNLDDESHLIIYKLDAMNKVHASVFIRLLDLLNKIKHEQQQTTNIGSYRYIIKCERGYQFNL